MNERNNGLGNGLSNKYLKKAIKCLRSAKYSESCGHFCIAFKLLSNCSESKELSLKWFPTFLYVFDRHINHLETNGDNNPTIINAFNEAMDVFPDSEDLFYNKGIYFYKRGNISEAVSCFVSSLTLNPNYNLSHLCLENIKSSAIPRWHYIMINDIKRNTAFREAIQRAVQKGFNTVLDIGCGSGLLSLYSVESGAQRVYACEVSDILYHMCRDVLETNGALEKVTLFNQMSTDLQIPEAIEKPVSLVVSEIFDAALFGEHVLTTIRSALKTLLDPNHGLVLPMSATVYGILIESDELRDVFTFNNKRFGNIVVSEEVLISVDINDFKYSTINLSKVFQKKYLTEKFTIISINFNDLSQIESLLEKDFVLNIDANCVDTGRLDAIGVWFDLNIFEDIWVSTEPPNGLIGWEQAIYPASVRPINVDHKTDVSMSFTLNEDFLRLIDLKVDNKTNVENDCQTLEMNSEIIQYLNANNFHNTYINAIEKTIETKSITNLIDFNFFSVSVLHFIQNHSINDLFLIKDDNQSIDYMKKFISFCNLETNKVKFLSFDGLVALEPQIQHSLVVFDLIETSGLMRSNLLEKLAYLKVYSLDSPVFMPFKVIVKGLLIQSEDLIIRSRLLTDDNVHGFKIKSFINIFETETLQSIDVKKIEFSKLSHCFDLLEINFNELFNQSNDEINSEPKNHCSVDVIKAGQLDAVLYWYELYLTEDIIISSIDLTPNWHLASFVLKQPFPVIEDNKIDFSVMFTNGFLRFIALKTV